MNSMRPGGPLRTLSAIVPPVVSAVGNIVGANEQSNAITDAARIQAETAAKALAYEKERDQYARYLATNRYGALGSVLGMHDQLPMTVPGIAPETAATPAPPAGPGVRPPVPGTSPP